MQNGAWTGHDIEYQCSPNIDEKVPTIAARTTISSLATQPGPNLCAVANIQVLVGYNFAGSRSDPGMR